MENNAHITQEVLEAENRYLTKIVGWSVAALISTLVFIGGWQIKVLNELVTKVDESTVANNNRFNQIENRINIGREKGTAIVEALKAEDKRLWKAIEELKK